MRYLFLACIGVILAAAAAGTGGWSYHFGHDSQTLRTIHYDKGGIDLSSRRREPAQ